MKTRIVKSVQDLKAIYYGNIDEYADDESLYFLQPVVWRTCHINEAHRYIVRVLLFFIVCLLLGSAFSHCQSRLKQSAEVANHVCHQKLRWILSWKLRWILTNQRFESKMISCSTNGKKVYSTINHALCLMHLLHVDFIYLFIFASGLLCRVVLLTGVNWQS